MIDIDPWHDYQVETLKPLARKKVPQLEKATSGGSSESRKRQRRHRWESSQVKINVD